jgi:hypothetical protein
MISIKGMKKAIVIGKRPCLYTKEMVLLSLTVLFWSRLFDDCVLQYFTILKMAKMRVNDMLMLRITLIENC